MASDEGIDNLIASASRVLRERRESLGWTLYKAAQESGVSWQMVKQVELGERRPSLEIFCKMALGLKMSPSKVLASAEKSRLDT